MRTVFIAPAVLALAASSFATGCASSMPRGQAQVGWLIAADSDVKSEKSADDNVARESAPLGALDARLESDLEQHFVLREHVPAALSFHCVDPSGLPTCAATPATDDAVAVPSKPDFILPSGKVGAR